MDNVKRLEKLVNTMLSDQGVLTGLAAGETSVQEEISGSDARQQFHLNLQISS